MYTSNVYLVQAYGAGPRPLLFVFASQVKTLLFLAHFRNCLVPWVTYGGAIDGVLQNITPLMLGRLANLQERLKLRGDEENFQDYRVKDDPLLARARRVVK